MRSSGPRICSIAVVLSVVVALVSTATASAAVIGQSVAVTASPPKQPKKQFGPLKSLATAVDTTYAPPFTPNATLTVINYSRDVKFTSGALPQCDLNQINTVPSSTAESICGAARVGQGSALINDGALTGQVIAYNGQPTGGSPTIGLHTDVFGPTGAYAFSTTLTGVLNLKTNALSVSIPPTGTSITHFDTTINKIRTGKKNGQPIYYAMARCSKKKWVSGATTTFDNGQQISATSVQRCRRTAAKNFKGGSKKGKGGKKKAKSTKGAPKNGAYDGKTDQVAISPAFRKVQFTLKKGRITLTTEPTVAREACVSAPVFTIDRTPSKKLSRNGTFSITHTFLGNKIDKIHGRFVSSTEVEGYAIYHFPAQDLCSAGKFRVNFRARHK